jgi:hypothetical protein
MLGTRMASAFRATIEQIGINPYVSLPPRRLAALFEAAGKQRGPIPVVIEIGGATFRQSLVKYQGAWRLYLNTPMRAAAGKSVGQGVTLKVDFDPAPRVEPMPPALRLALAKDERAKAAFAALVPSRQKEIQRYLNSAKTAATVERNVAKVVAWLTGEAPAALAVLGSGRGVRRR